MWNYFLNCKYKQNAMVLENDMDHDIINLNSMKLIIILIVNDLWLRKLITEYEIHINFLSENKSQITLLQKTLTHLISIDKILMDH